MNDVILQDAFDVARRHLADAVQPVHRHEIVIASCTEYPTAWVFGLKYARVPDRRFHGRSAGERPGLRGQGRRVGDAGLVRVPRRAATPVAVLTRAAGWAA